ncbi:hypothetical protein [Vagococcus fluvialis]|uniref:hypothetical protein n=1 Tax=Vagococcus fluvialis TaxID=2738 RepID=UPI00378766C3
MITKKKIIMLFLMFYVLIIGGCSLFNKPKSLEETIKNKTFTFELLDTNGKTINDKFGVIYFSYHDKYFYNTSTNSLERAIEKFDDKTEEKGGLSKRDEDVSKDQNYTVTQDTITLSRGIGINKIGANIYNLKVNDDGTITGDWGTFLAQSSSSGYIDCKVILKEK